MSTSDSYSSFLATNGVSLEALGLHERAFTRSDAKRAVQILRELVVPILGGDVYFQRAGRRIEPAYANWHIDKGRDESQSDFADRSWSETDQYVDRIPDALDAALLFVFVVGDAENEEGP